MNENLVLTQDDLTLTKNSENCRLTAYPDPGTGAAPWTIGWGHTGPEVHPGLVWTQAQADAQLLVDMQRAEANVRSVVTIPLTQDEFAALCDFAFNIGCGAFDSSTLLKKLNAYDLEGAIAEFAKWNMAGGQVLQGLVKRRDGEKALFLLGCDFSQEANSA
ncbi:lysozyme [Paraburkholderia youngii]|uniref:lysozyme n=1 Tax=Paraburkholderia youngii TaxID=2782701 RepID=UPI001591C109|nr:lysozyme [Paraburkholderia youngii]NUX58648.1 lysozyme [Paraburkholderia youngii]